MEPLALSASAVRQFEPNRDAVVTFDAIVCSQQWEYVDADGSDAGQRWTLSINCAFRTRVKTSISHLGCFS